MLASNHGAVSAPLLSLRPNLSLGEQRQSQIFLKRIFQLIRNTPSFACIRRQDGIRAGACLQRFSREEIRCTSLLSLSALS
jgi:hypothetical protein